MPASSTHTSLERQWELLKLLPSKAPGKTVLELQCELANSGFIFTKRTVQRDLVELELIFPLICNDEVEPHTWHWQEGSSVELPGISVTEAQTLLLVKDLLKPLVPSTLWKTVDDRFAAATRKLDVLASRNVLARWADKVRSVPNTLPLRAPEINDSILAAVQDALLRDCQCQVQYQGLGAESATQQTLNPLALLQRGPVTYLVATADAYQEPRLYAVHRLKKVEVLQSPLRKPPRFNLDSYIATGGAQFGNGKTIVLTAGVSSVLASILAETPLSPDMKLQGTDSPWTKMTATVQDTWQLRWWILSQGSDIVVHKPAEVRREIKKQVTAMLDNYRDATTK